MKNYIHIIRWIFVIPFVFNSCDNLIEVDLPANQIASELVFADVKTADAALAGVYAGLWNNSPLSGDKFGVLLGLYTDDLDLYATTATNGIPEIFYNQLIPNNPIVYGQWSSAYQLVYSCNAIIEGCNRSHLLGNDDKKRIKGEALLIRSILLYNMQQLFGEIPYPISTNYLLNQSLPKKTENEVLELLGSDLAQCSEALTDAYRNTERIYINKKVAQLMLAKVYLLQQRWVESEHLLKQIINNGLYQIQNDVSKTFKKSGSNILWQLKPYHNDDSTKEAIAYYFDYMPPYNFALSDDLVNCFSPSDLRKDIWITPITFAGTTWYRAYKYKNLFDNADEYSIVFRIEEAYLLMAETLCRQNKTTEALPFLNAIRIRAALPEIASPISQEALLSEILLENRREFFTEMGHRFFDLKRMNSLDQLSLTKPNWNVGDQRWPIPEKELLLNPNLNPQNDGY